MRQESPDGRQEGTLTIGEDITDRLKAQRDLAVARREMERLMRANMLGELASSLAHELNQPLAAILSNAQAAQRLLGSNALERRELGDILGDIVRDDRRASEVITRMRSMVRKEDIRPERVQLNDSVHAVGDLIGSELDARGVRLRLALGDDLPLAVASRIDVQLVMMNLLLNAVRAVNGQPKGGRSIWVETSAQDHQVRVVVADSGIGIARDVAERMFEPFFTTKPSGIGMGLAISRRIVEAHGGHIWVENRKPRGARFSFSLPVATDTNGAANA